MNQWEYKFVATGSCKEKRLEEVLDQMGLEGWELIFASHRMIWDESPTDVEHGLLLIFKRPKAVCRSEVRIAL